MGQTRPAGVAGSFYPSDPRKLAETVDALLEAVEDPRPRDGVLAVVVPHAGYAYSAPVAASAYARLTGLRETISRVAVLGPAHFVDLAGLAVPTVTWLDTPLGVVGVDTAACRRLVETGLAAFSDAAHADEHSIEVQLPFLRRILGGDASYVPVAVGPSEPDRVADALDLLSADLVVVSTDLSHYLDQASAQGRDRHTAEAVVARRVEQIGRYDACGRHALRGLLRWAARHDHHIELVDLRTSADTVGGPHRVVGYGAFVVTSASA